MIESEPLSWTLVVVLAATGLWFLCRGLSAGSGDAAPGTAERITHVAHAVMAAVMAAMIWPM